MAIENIITAIGTALDEGMRGHESKSDRRVYIDIESGAVKTACSVMLENLGARFQIATGVDTPAGIEVMYHWALDQEDCVVTLRVLLDPEHPELDSIALLCPAAEWIEREMWELLGIHFRGHPDLRHLLLDDDWPEGNYPLRRDQRPSP